MNALQKNQALAQARAVFELQTQAGFMLQGASGVTFSVQAAENIDETGWQTIAAQKPLLLITGSRAKRLGLEAGTQPVALPAGGLAFAELHATIAGVQATPPKPSETPDFAGPLLGLLKRAGLLPAALMWPIPSNEKGFCLSEETLRAELPVEVRMGEKVSLPIAGAENSQLVSFRAASDHAVHLALLIGAPEKSEAPLVRVHSSCVTGDLLGSLRCDCGDQLHAAIDAMKEEGSGVLLYLYQEGRGIGISSKLRAYGLQETGMDTFAANEHLGFEEDERDFSVAAAMLSALSIRKFRLLTNNPVKIQSFEDSGLTVAARIPLPGHKNLHNQAYLAAKQLKHGHF